MLNASAARGEKPQAASQAVDFKAFCAARFVIDLLKPSVGAARRQVTKKFFTKLSTEFVHSRWRATGGRHGKGGAGKHRALRHN